MKRAVITIISTVATALFIVFFSYHIVRGSQLADGDSREDTSIMIAQYLGLSPDAIAGNSAILLH